MSSRDLTNGQKTLVALVTVGGFMVYGSFPLFVDDIPERSVIFINTVLATMGPLVGWVIKGLFDAPRERKGEEE